ncbi:hypothetical protein G7046_g4896 [Stylonectria norvegica]|nr:hypothetical protein G7046_g4896 [Stylonectria norvegica]
MGNDVSPDVANVKPDILRGISSNKPRISTDSGISLSPAGLPPSPSFTGHGAATTSRRTASQYPNELSSRSLDSSIESLVWLGPSPTSYAGRFSPGLPEARAARSIQEADDVLITEQKSPKRHSSDYLDPDTARAPYTGQGLPVIDANSRPGPPRDPSEITDLGMFGRRQCNGVKEDDQISLASEQSSSDGESSRETESLESKLFAPLRDRSGENSGFIPRGHIQRVLHEDTIREELCRCQSEGSLSREAPIDQYIDQMNVPGCQPSHYMSRQTIGKKTYLNIFAILVLIEKTAAIGQFLCEGIDDSALPLLSQARQNSKHLHLTRRDDGASRIKAFSGWSYSKKFHFEKWQWAVLAPYFFRGNDGTIHRFKLPKSTILPFIKSDSGASFREEEEHEGGFSSVTKVYIHADHHNFETRKGKISAFAVKKLKTRDYKAYINEFRNLARLRTTPHQHLVSLLAGFSRGNVYCLLFEWAESDLSIYWFETHPKPNFDLETVQWVAQQCAGLASGLEEFHRYGSIKQERARESGQQETSAKLYGRHGDIKPENIFLYRDPRDPSDQGTLKIGDFGSAEFNTTQSRSNKANDHIATSRSYQPPECDLISGKISRSYDIWTMGCLYLEFVAWLLGGWELVRHLAVVRKPQGVHSGIPAAAPFYDSDGHGTAKVKPEVTKFIEEAHAAPKCSQFVHDFLDLIEADLLVVETTTSVIPMTALNMASPDNSDSDASQDSVHSLTSDICRSYAKSHLHDKDQDYIPEGLLEELITDSAVREVLGSSVDSNKNQELIDFIVKRANKVFTLAILANLSGKNLWKAMKAFKKKEFDNKSLPLIATATELLGTGPFRNLKIWGLNELYHFREDQWKVLVPVFRQVEELTNTLFDSCILPFELVDSDVKEGTFGDVYQVRIHPGHLDEALYKRNANRHNVAVKEIKTSQLLQQDANEAFDIEAMALSKCRKVEHENLTPCLAAIEKGSLHYFLFPWATGGSLRDFWKRSPKPPLSQSLVKDVLEQLHGLSGALEALHSYGVKRTSFPKDAGPEILYNGSGGIRHGDLKPENILIFDAPAESRTGLGTLKIADMGLAKHHDVNTRLRENVTGTKYGTRRYEPPEVDTRALATSRLYDTWSMGCIMLEFIVWLLYDLKTLDNFNHSIRGGVKMDSEPPYYVISNRDGPRTARLHPSIVDCISDLSQHPECMVGKTALGDLLAIVRDRLLVIDLPSSSETTEPNAESFPGIPVVSTPEKDQLVSRATARQLRKSLADILDKARDKPTYLLMEAPPRTSSTRYLASIRRQSSSNLHPKAAQEMARREKPNTRTRMKGNASGLRLSST